MIEIKQIPKMTVASMQYFIHKATTKLINQITEEFEKSLLKVGIPEIEYSAFFTVFHVDSFRDTNYNMELWMQVEERKGNSDNIQFKEIDESEAAYVVTAKDYNNLSAPYITLFNYINEKGYKLNGFPRERYLPDETTPLGFLTEIQLPFKQ